MGQGCIGHSRSLCNMEQLLCKKTLGARGEGYSSPFIDSSSLLLNQVCFTKMNRKANYGHKVLITHVEL